MSGCEVGVGELEHASPGRRPRASPVDAGASLSHHLADAEPIEDGQAGRLEQDHRPDRSGLRRPLEHLHAVACAAEQQCRRRTRGPAPDHGDVEQGLELPDALGALVGDAGKRVRERAPVGKPEPGIELQERQKHEAAT